MHFGLYVHFCPGGFSKTIHRIIFKSYIAILQILQKCNVIVMIDKHWKLLQLSNFENWLLRSKAFSTQCVFCTGVFSKTVHRIIFKCYVVILQKLKKCNVLVSIEIIDNCLKYPILTFYEDFCVFDPVCTFVIINAFPTQCAFCPSDFSKTTQRINGNCIQKLKECSVVVLIVKTEIVKSSDF